MSVTNHIMNIVLSHCFSVNFNYVFTTNMQTSALRIGFSSFSASVKISASTKIGRPVCCTQAFNVCVALCLTPGCRHTMQTQCICQLWYALLFHCKAAHNIRKQNWIQESLAIAKTTARCAQYMGALKSFESPRKRPRLLFPKLVKGFCSDRY